MAAMQYDGAWTLSLPGGVPGAPTDNAAPLMTNGKIGVVCSFASHGIDTSRSVIGASASGGLRYGTLTDAFHPCRFRFISAPGEELNQSLLLSDDPELSLSLDMNGAALYSSFIGTRPSDGVPLCVAMHSVRVLRHMPHFMLHTLALTVAAEHQEGFQVIHELRADPAILSPRFDSTVIDGLGDQDSNGVYMLTARGKRGGDGVDVFAVSTYMLEDPDRTECCGFNAHRRSVASAFTRLRLRRDATQPTTFTYTIHVLTGLMTSDDAEDADEQLRRAILCQLAPQQSAAEAANAMCRRHVYDWTVLWMSEVWFDIKQSATQEEATRARRFQGLLRYAVYNLHSSARPGSIVDLACTFANGGGDAFIMPALLILQMEAGLGALDAHHAALPAATLAAAAFGYRGAKFPFQGDDAGGGTSALYYAAERPLCVFNCALAAVATWDYYRISMDRDWLQDRGYAVLRAVADLLVSAVERDPDSPTVFYFRNSVGLDDAVPPAKNNALTVASAICALRCTMEASYELGYFPKESWSNVRYGLMVPLTSTNVVMRDADALAPVANGTMSLEPLIVLRPQISDAAFGPDSGRSFGPAIIENVNAWAPASSMHPLDRMILAFANAQRAQVEPLPGDAEAAAEAFFSSFDAPLESSPWQKSNDLNLSAMLLLSVMQGLGGVAIIGGVTETRFYYTEMGVIASVSAALPTSWERMYVRGVGPAQKDFSVLNHLLYPASKSDDSSLIVPWSVSALTF